MVKFHQLIRDIQKKGGFTEQQIADQVGVGQTTISRLKLSEGSEPRYSTGVRLVELHRSIAFRSTYEESVNES